MVSRQLDHDPKSVFFKFLLHEDSLEGPFLLKESSYLQLVDDNRPRRIKPLVRLQTVFKTVIGEKKVTLLLIDNGTVRTFRTELLSPVFFLRRRSMFVENGYSWGFFLFPTVCCRRLGLNLFSSHM